MRDDTSGLMLHVLHLRYFWRSRQKPLTLFVHLLLFDSSRTLFLFGTYSIGKERVFMSVAQKCGIRVVS